jgi:hypothetical protein
MISAAQNSWRWKRAPDEDVGEVLTQTCRNPQPPEPQSTLHTRPFAQQTVMPGPPVSHLSAGTRYTPVCVTTKNELETLGA